MHTFKREIYDNIMCVFIQTYYHIGVIPLKTGILIGAKAVIVKVHLAVIFLYFTCIDSNGILKYICIEFQAFQLHSYTRQECQTAVLVVRLPGYY